MNQAIIKVSSRIVPILIYDNVFFVISGCNSVHGPYELNDNRFLIVIS